jgi:hypothetical protein
VQEAVKAPVAGRLRIFVAQQNIWFQCLDANIQPALLLTAQIFVGMLRTVHARLSRPMGAM